MPPLADGAILHLTVFIAAGGRKEHVRQDVNQVAEQDNGFFSLTTAVPALA